MIRKDVMSIRVHARDDDCYDDCYDDLIVLLVMLDVMLLILVAIGRMIVLVGCKF